MQPMNHNTQKVMTISDGLTVDHSQELAVLQGINRFCSFCVVGWAIKLGFGPGQQLTLGGIRAKSGSDLATVLDSDALLSLSLSL